MRRITAAAILAATTFHAFARDLPAASPESVGMSSERLDRIGAAMHRYVGDGKIAGMVSLVARHGKIVYANAVGEQALTNKPAMARDTLFRICSMTKPITAVTAMTLYEEGGFPLTDPVSTYLPEFKDLKVLEGCTIPRTGCCRAKTPTLAGFGLGVAVLVDVAESAVAGFGRRIQLGGAAGTEFWIDPVEDIVVQADGFALAMAQRTEGANVSGNHEAELKNAIARSRLSAQRAHPFQSLIVRQSAVGQPIQNVAR